MAEAIVEQILAQWRTTLSAISVVNGYRNDVEKVERWRAGSMAQEGNVLLEIKQGATSAPELQVMGTELRTVTVTTLLKIRHDPDTDALSSDTVMNRLEQDVYQAIMADPTRGGLGETTRYQGSAPAELEEGTARVVKAVDYAVDFRHSTTDMSIP